MKNKNLTYRPFGRKVYMFENNKIRISSNGLKQFFLS